MDADAWMIAGACLYGMGYLFWTMFIWAVLEEPYLRVPVLVVFWPVLAPILISVAVWDALRARQTPRGPDPQ